MILFRRNESSLTYETFFIVVLTFSEAVSTVIGRTFLQNGNNNPVKILQNFMSALQVWGFCSVVSGENVSLFFGCAQETHSLLTLTGSSGTSPLRCSNGYPERILQHHSLDLAVLVTKSKLTYCSHCGVCFPFSFSPPVRMDFCPRRDGLR